jgi:hypothetical protein
LNTKVSSSSAPYAATMRRVKSVKVAGSCDGSN